MGWTYVHEIKERLEPPRVPRRRLPPPAHPRRRGPHLQS